MTVSSTTSKIAYTGNGVTTLYAFPYPFIAASDLQVYVGGVLKALTTDYTISGSAPYPAGANVTFLSAPANLASILIIRVRPFTQTLDLVANDPLPAEDVERDFDHVVMLAQQLNEAIGRAITIPSTDVTGTTVLLPAAAARANQALIFDALGNVAVGAVSSAVVSAAMQPVVAALTLALARVALGVGSNFTTETAITAAATTDLGSLDATSQQVSITGNTGITSFGNTANVARPTYLLRFTGTPTLTNSANIIIAGGANWTAAAGDMAIAKFEGSSVWRVFPLLANGQAVSSPIAAPQGRLSLSSTAAVMTADAVAQTTVYYLPYIGQKVSVYNGASWGLQDIGSSGLSIALDNASGHTGYHQSGKNFDHFVFNDSGTMRLGTGPAWSSDTVRGTGAGTTELQQLNGIWTNKNSITLRWGSASGNTTVVAANQATYVGSMRATADGQTGVAMKPAAGAGGSNPIVGLFNAYNRVPLKVLNQESTANWSYATATWRAANGSNSNRVSFIDGLQQISTKGQYDTVATTAGANPAIQTGVNLDSTSATPNVAHICNLITTGQNFIIAGRPEIFAPQLGFHFISAMEISNSSVSVTFQGIVSTCHSSTLTVDTEY